MKTVAHWSDADFGGQPFGGKAHALAQLCRAGFAVPPWLVVLPAGEELGSLEFAGPYAVRSSAVEEDGAEHSFAGQLESFLNVPLAEVWQRIGDVRRSARAERVGAYRRQAGLPAEAATPGVIVQQMVQPTFAGVAFSADPVSGRRGVTVVAAVRGLAEGLVNGTREAEGWTLARDGEVLSRRGPETGMRGEEAQRVAALARAVERHFGVPQDIEWALAPDGLWLLQARPITNLAGLPDPDGEFQLWDNSNIAESYSGVTTPLTFSFARHAYEGVYRELVRILGVSPRRIAANGAIFARMIGLVQGRIYYNLVSWYRVLALLPGFALNRRFMEGMMGVKEALPEALATQIAAEAKPPGRWQAWWEVARTLAGLAWNHLRLERQIERFRARLDRVLGEAPELAELRPDELVAEYRRLQRELLTRWDAPLVNDFFAMIHHGVLRRLSASWCGDEDGRLANSLLSHQGGIISTEPARLIRELADLARPHAALVKTLGEAPAWQIAQALPAHPEFARACADYLARFADRCLGELKLESPTLADDPLPFYRSIAQLAARPTRPIGEAARHEEVALAGVRRWLFQFVLRHARRRVRDRENLRFERTRVFGRVRRIFVELGHRLHALRVLEAPEDVFCLMAEEVLGFVEGTGVTWELRALAELRKQEFARYREVEPSSRFTTHGVVGATRTFAGNAPPVEAEGDRRQGTGCSPGVIRGLACVVRDPRGATVPAGAILVAERTDPGWILLFASAAGLVVEHGSLLSHAAIVSRELGLPAVIGLPRATRWLANGDLVEIDGSTGSVVRIDPGPASS